MYGRGPHPVSGPCALKADITDAYASNSTRHKKKRDGIPTQQSKGNFISLPSRRRVLRALTTAID